MCFILQKEKIADVWHSLNYFNRAKLVTQSMEPFRGISYCVQKHQQFGITDMALVLFSSGDNQRYDRQTQQIDFADKTILCHGWFLNCTTQENSLATYNSFNLKVLPHLDARKDYMASLQEYLERQSDDELRGILIFQIPMNSFETFAEDIAEGNPLNHFVQRV